MKYFHCALGQLIPLAVVFFILFWDKQGCVFVRLATDQPHLKPQALCVTARPTHCHQRLLDRPPHTASQDHLQPRKRWRRRGHFIINFKSLLTFSPLLSTSRNRKTLPECQLFQGMLREREGPVLMMDLNFIHSSTASAVCCLGQFNTPREKACHKVQSHKTVRW